MSHLKKIIVSRLWCFVAILTIVSCATKEQVVLGNSHFGEQEAKVILIPMEGWNNAEVNEIAGTIEARHQLRVMTYTTMGKNAKMFNAEKQQFLSEEIARTAWRVLQKNGDVNLTKAIIVLTKDDINTEDFRLRYVFASHFDQIKLSVISTARINPINYGAAPDRNLVMHRLEKLIDKSLGLHLYGYKIGTDKKSVMYGPIMSPDDLDSLGDSY